MEPRIFLRGEPGCAPMMDYSNPALRNLLNWSKPILGLVELTKSEFRNAYPGERLPVFTENPRGEACIWRVTAHLDLLPDGLMEEIETFKEDYKKFIEIELDKQFRAELAPSAEHLCKTYVSQVLKRDLTTWVEPVTPGVDASAAQPADVQPAQPADVQPAQPTAPTDVQQIAEQLVRTLAKQLAPTVTPAHMPCQPSGDYSTLTPAEARILHAIDSGYHSTERIAAHLSLSKNRAYSLLKRLKDKGFIESGYIRKGYTGKR